MKKLETLKIDAKSEFPKIKVFINGEQIDGESVNEMDIHLKGGVAAFEITKREYYSVGDLDDKKN